MTSPASSKSRIRVFVSFDFDHDAELYERLLAQSETSASSFGISGSSERRSATDVWSDRVRSRIRSADQVIVICGEHSEDSVSMSAELRMAQEERTPYTLLWGRREVMCTKPIGAKPAEGMYSWTRQILQDQIAFSLRRASADATVETLGAALRKG